MRVRVPAPAVPASTLPPVAACLPEPPTRINDRKPSRIKASSPYSNSKGPTYSPIQTLEKRPRVVRLSIYFHRSTHTWCKGVENIVILRQKIPFVEPDPSQVKSRVANDGLQSGSHRRTNCERMEWSKEPKTWSYKAPRANFTKNMTIGSSPLGSACTSFDSNE